jgi:ATP-binding cassette, subfamily B, bacterial
MTDTPQSDIPESAEPPRLKAQDKARSLAPLRRLVPFLLRYPVRLTLTVIFLLVAAIASLSIPYLAGGFIDEGFAQENLEVVSGYAWLIIIIAAVMAAAAAARFYFISVIGERVITDLRQEVFDHLLTLDATFFDVNRVGELTSRLNADVATIRQAVGSSASLALRSLILAPSARNNDSISDQRSSLGVGDAKIASSVARCRLFIRR